MLERIICCDCKFVRLLLLLLLCHLILFSCFSVNLFVCACHCYCLFVFCFFLDTSLNTYVIEALRFSGLFMILVNFVSYKVLRKSGWILLGETL